MNAAATAGAGAPQGVSAIAVSFAGGYGVPGGPYDDALAVLCATATVTTTATATAATTAAATSTDASTSKLISFSSVRIRDMTPHTRALIFINIIVSTL